MTLVILALVLSRYLFLYSFPWAEELTKYLMVWMALLGAAVILRQDEHIRVNYFFNLLPKNVATVVQIIFRLLIIVYFVVLCKQGFTTAISMWIIKSPGLGVSMFWPYSAIYVTAALMIIFAVNNLFDDLSTIFKNMKTRSSNRA